MVAPYRLLAKIILTNLCPILRHMKLTAKKAQFMYAITTNVPIDLASYFIDVIQKDFSNKESSFSFEGLITRVASLAKIPLRDVEPIMKIFGKISAVTVVKSEVVVSKKGPFVDESTSSQLESPSTNSLLPLIIEHIQFLTNKFDSFIGRWDKKAREVDKLLSNIQ